MAVMRNLIYADHLRRTLSIFRPCTTIFLTMRNSSEIHKVHSIANGQLVTYYADQTAIVEGEVCEGTKIYAHAHVSKGAFIGKNCMIGEGVFIGRDVLIGNNVRIQNHAQIFEGVTIYEDCFIGPCVCFTNDKYPQVTQEWELLRTFVRKGASIGANATILCGIEIGEGAMVGAGSVVTKSVEPNKIIYGNPAK